MISAASSLVFHSWLEPLDERLSCFFEPRYEQASDAILSFISIAARAGTGAIVDAVKCILLWCQTHNLLLLNLTVTMQLHNCLAVVIYIGNMHEIASANRSSSLA